MDKNTIFLAVGFFGGIILTNILIGLGRVKYNQYKKKKEMLEYYENISYNSLNNQNQTNYPHKK